MNEYIDMICCHIKKWKKTLLLKRIPALMLWNKKALRTVYNLQQIFYVLIMNDFVCFCPSGEFFCHLETPPLAKEGPSSAEVCHANCDTGHPFGRWFLRTRDIHNYCPVFGSARCYRQAFAGTRSAKRCAGLRKH